METSVNTPLYKRIACAVAARHACVRSQRHDLVARWDIALNHLVAELPSGSGVDKGTQLNAASTGDKLIFDVSFHHMDEHGYYDGWTDHQVIVTPSLQHEFLLRVTGINKRNIKEYLTELYADQLYRVITQEQWGVMFQQATA
jgi:hypothetical protein